MMKAWQSALGQTWRLWLGHPRTDGIAWFLFIMATIAVFVAMQKTTKAVCAGKKDNFRTGLATALLMLLPAVATVAAKLYLAPHLAHGTLQRILPFLIPVVTCLVLVVPCCIFVFRCNYLTSLISVCVSLIAAATVVLLLSGVFQMANQGGKEIKKTRQRTVRMSELFGTTPATNPEKQKAP